MMLNFFVILLFGLGSISHCAAKETTSPELLPHYQWGRGITWQAINLNLGGYFNAVYEHPQQFKESVSLNDLSLFFTWSPHQRLRFFAEIETENWLSTQGVDSLDNTLSTERLYLDILTSPASTLRLGKFLTPIGRWNLTHVSPLIWTTSRPLVTERRLFTSHVNGAMFTHRVDFNVHTLNVAFYLDESATLDAFDYQLGFENGVGSRVTLDINENLQIGASWLNFKNKSITPKSSNQLLGIDLLWKKNHYELEIEAIYRTAEDNQGTEHGLYLQSVVPLMNDFYAISRYEYVNGTHRYLPTITHIGVTGLAWKPFTPLIIKAEYLFGDNNQFVAPTGLFASVSMFF